MIGRDVSQEKQLSDGVKKLLEGMTWWFVGFPLFIGWVFFFLGSIGILVYQTSRWLKNGFWTEIPISSFLPINENVFTSLEGGYGIELIHSEAWIILSVTSFIAYYSIHFLYRLLSDWWSKY